jgi:hypothetical protein
MEGLLLILVVLGLPLLALAALTLLGHGAGRLYAAVLAAGGGVEEVEEVEEASQARGAALTRHLEAKLVA